MAAYILDAVRTPRGRGKKVNVNGSAIALGHPLDAAGAVLLGTALAELGRHGQKTALITRCIAGGQGIATIIERV